MKATAPVGAASEDDSSGISLSAQSSARPSTVTNLGHIKSLHHHDGAALVHHIYRARHVSVGVLAANDRLRQILLGENFT